MFQSLSGFLTRCDQCNSGVLRTVRHGFNPYRVFSLVATSVIVEYCEQSGMVSIPIGFSHSLRRRAEYQSCPPRTARFNPYRVFSLVATRTLRRPSHSASTSFNPYRVFSLVATPRQAFKPFVLFLVSIPIGFSHSLRPAIDILRFVLIYDGFNPYRVFSLVATEMASI